LFMPYVRWALLTGKVGAAAHDASLESLMECLRRERGERLAFGGVRRSVVRVHPTQAHVGCRRQTFAKMLSLERPVLGDEPRTGYSSWLECSCVRVGRPPCNRIPCIEDCERAALAGQRLE
jgi:hypothetical protein